MSLSACLAASLILNQGGIKSPQLQKAENEPRTIAAFEHVTNKLNVAGNVTTIDNPTLNGKPDAILLVTRLGSFQETPPAVGVWFNNGKWTIFRQDRQPIRNGERFVVEAFEKGPYAFEVTNEGSGSHMCDVPSQNMPKVKGKGLFVTSVYTAKGTYNTNALGTWHNGAVWTIFHPNRQPIPKGAGFHVVYGRAEQVNVPNDQDKTFLDLNTPWLNSAPEVLLTTGNTYDDATKVYVPYPTSTAYLDKNWRIAGSTQDYMAAGSSFFIRSSGSRPLTAPKIISGEAAKSNRFMISLLGFKCLKATPDNVLETDGKGDEIYFAISFGLRTGDRAESLGLYKVGSFGDTSAAGAEDRTQAGSAGPNGGIKPGDLYINPGPGQPGGRPPMNVLSVKLNEGQTLCLVPSVWEKDHQDDQANLTYFTRVKPAEQVISEWITLDKKPSVLRLAYLKNAAAIPPTYPDIPIGSTDTGIRAEHAPAFAPTYACWIPVRFYDSNELGALADAAGPHGQGTFVVRCGDLADYSFGCYEVILKVERMLGAGE